MKSFIKYTIAAIIGFTITFVIACIIGVSAIVGLIMSDDNGTPEIKGNSVLVVKLSGNITEHVEKDSPLTSLFGEIEAQGLDEIVTAIDKAATTPEIAGIYIEAGMVEADYATLQEIRNALLRVKNKKWIASYADTYTQGTYYVCSVADNVWINPQGMVDIHGLGGQTTYLKDLLSKVGIKMKVVKVGTYKSATETFTEDHMSDANREQTTRYVQGLWNIVANDIAKSRNLTIKEVNALADTLTLLKDTEFLIANKLITKTLYSSEVKEEIKKLLKQDLDDEISQISCSTLAKEGKEINSSSEKIAVYYAQGTISQNEETGYAMGDVGIISKTMISDLEKIAKDDDIKAVVIRINSGGGDAFASEDIWHSVLKLKAKKPVVISMGSVAASGAYYLSAGASWIVAQPTTLTGSIGIFGMFPDMTELLQDKLGLKYDKVTTNKHSDFTSAMTARPLTAGEEAMLQEYINRGYELFCKRVSDGRKIPMAQVKAVAEGRVWIAEDAKKHKLVDEIGGMGDAIKKACQLAKIDKYETIYYPEKKPWYEGLLSDIEKGNNNLDEQLHSTLGIYYEPFKMVKNIKNQNPIQAHIPVLISIE